MASATNVYVKGLPAHCDEGMLRGIFEPFGPIASVRTMKDRGFGFVQYSTPAAATAAIASLNGSMMDGTTLMLKYADRNAGDKAAMKAAVFGAIGNVQRGVPLVVPTKPSDNVFVGNVPLQWSEADLNALFSSCGPIVSSVILMNKQTGRSKGAGMVRFADAATARVAVQSLNGSVVDGTGRQLEVRFAESPVEKGARKMATAIAGGPALRFSPYGVQPGVPMMAGGPGLLSNIRSPAVGPMSPQAFGGKITVPLRKDVTPEEGSNVYIFGLDQGVTDLHLYQAFAGYGAIRSVRVTKDPATGLSKGYGFVQFFNAQDARGAIAALNGLQVGTKTWSVTAHKKK